MERIKTFKRFSFKRLLLIIVVVLCACLTYLISLYAPKLVKDIQISETYRVHYCSYRGVNGTSDNVSDTEDYSTEILDSNSPLFGRKYKYIHGVPFFNNNTGFYDEFIEGLPPWENFMPNLIISLEKLALFNSEGDRRKSTSPLSYCSFPEAKDYTVGDVFEFKIQAVDFLQRSKPFGGDYFRVRLIKKSLNKNLPPDGIPCAVEDHLNGTYTVRAPLLAHGIYTLEVLLVSSVEAVASFVSWSAGRVHEGYVYQATLLSNETVYCNTDLPLNDKYKGQQFCDYSNPRNDELWICTAPPSCRCSPITFITFDGAFGDNYFFKKPFDIRNHVKDRFKSYQQLKGTGFEIKVLPNNGETDRRTIDRAYKAVAEGNYARKNDYALPNGFSHNGSWISLVRNYDRPSMKDLAKCFSNKVVYLIGDSTMFQFSDFCRSSFKLKVNISDGSKYFHCLRVNRNENLNITVYYRAHGPPFRLEGPSGISPYVTDTINSIKVGGKDVVVIISMGLHLLEYEPMMYIHRLLAIKNALMRHLKKFPDTTVIIKGLNVSISQALPFEWLIYRFNILLREIFKDLKSSIYIDLWDMTTLWPTTEYHPDAAVIKEQAYLMFSYICDKPK